MGQNEFLNKQKEHVYLLGRFYSKYGIEDLGDLIPAMIHINRLENIHMFYMNRSAKDFTGKSILDAIEQKEEFITKHIHPDTVKFLLNNRKAKFNSGSAEHIVPHFQYLRRSYNSPYIWHYSSSKTISDDLVLTVSQPIKDAGVVGDKIEFLLQDHYLVKKNLGKYLRLTPREREILKLICQGCTSGTIAEMLFISILTVQTHRKRIKEKLEIKYLAEMIRIGEAFCDDSL